SLLCQVSLLAFHSVTVISDLSVPLSLSSCVVFGSFCFLSVTFCEVATRFVSLDLKMRYVAAYLLAVLGGNNSPASSDLEKILGSVGVEADGERLSRVIKELNGKSIDELIAQGREKLSSMPVGGAPAAAAAAPGAAPAAAEGKKEAKKEEKKEESESEDDDMGFGLFD
ncbi:unnamed protein product, partial [Phaedon cochleariae]